MLDLEPGSVAFLVQLVAHFTTSLQFDYQFLQLLKFRLRWNFWYGQPQIP